MGQAKIKRRDGFPPHLIDEWEAEDCVNFAVGVARLTGWLLHVDWITRTFDYPEDVSEHELIPARVYVGDNRKGVFDVRGIKTLVDFTPGTVVKIAKQRAPDAARILTRYYSEAELFQLPLRVGPDEEKIAAAMGAIQIHGTFLAQIPIRPAPRVPAHEAALYTFGRCAAYAEALHEITGLEPVALMAIRFTPIFAGTVEQTEDGYVHSVVVHQDGTAEDVWGRSSLEDIASRFGIAEFEINSEHHRQAVQRLRAASGEVYDDALKRARELIGEFRPDSSVV